MHRRGLNVRKALLKLALPTLRGLLPPARAARAVAGIGRMEVALAPGLRSRFEEAVENGRAFFDAGWDVPAVARDLAANQVRWRVRDQLLENLGDEDALATYRVRGREALEAARAEGRGLVFLGNHFGGHLLSAHWLLRAGVPLRLFMERPKSVSRRLAAGIGFDDDGPLGQKKLFISRKAEPSEAAASILRASRALKAGLGLLIASDVRWEGTGTIPARFLGREWNFSATWVRLAALTGAPVIPTFCRMAPDGGHDLEFLEPFHVPPEASRTGGGAEFVAGAIAEIERRVALDPTNSNEYLFWSGEFDSAAVTGRTRKRPVTTASAPSNDREAA